MKSKLTLLAIIAAAVAIVAGVPTYADIQGSPHDFSGESWSGHEICAPCHIPHNASSDAALWARGPLSELGPYQLFESDAVLGVRSLTCLSCHDGTLALDGSDTGEKMTGDAVIGTDLTNDHPIGVAYTTATSSTRWQIPPANGIRLYDGKVECASCHNVHGTNYGALLRTDNWGSKVCLSCHIR
jgi:predicted CXXCH cytochrome family protein